jgi:hypothetical protein
MSPRVSFRFVGDAREVRIRGGLETLPGVELVERDGVWETELDVPADIRANTCLSRR